MLSGRIFQDGRWWVAEVPVAGAITQGTSRSDASRMLVDWFRAMFDDPALAVTVTPVGRAGDILVEPGSPAALAALAALVLKHQREARGLTLAEVATALGSPSRNAYARYEQGHSIPSLAKFFELLRAVAPDLTLLLAPRPG